MHLPVPSTKHFMHWVNNIARFLNFNTIDIRLNDSLLYAVLCIVVCLAALLTNIPLEASGTYILDTQHNMFPDIAKYPF